MLVLLDNPQVAKDLIYNYRGTKIKGFRNEAGWNAVYVAGKIIKRIGPILAINSSEPETQHVTKKLIKGCPKKLKSIRIKGIISDSRKIKKDFFIFCVKRKNFNGEKFVKIAFKKGAVVCVVSKNLDQKIKICNLLKVIM